MTLISNSISSKTTPFHSSSRYLFYGIGNDGRQDDGVGIKFIQFLEQQPLPANVQLKSSFQLNIEDALEISQFDYVFFIDALRGNPESPAYSLNSVQPSKEIQFSTHCLSIESVLALSIELYQKAPTVYLLGISGFGWEITEKLSPLAQEHLSITLEHFLKWITTKL